MSTKVVLRGGPKHGKEFQIGVSPQEANERFLGYYKAEFANGVQYYDFDPKAPPAVVEIIGNLVPTVHLEDISVGKHENGLIAIENTKTGTAIMLHAEQAKLLAVNILAAAGLPVELLGGAQMVDRDNWRGVTNV